MRTLGIMFQSYSASKEEMLQVSIQFIIPTGYVDADYPSDPIL